MNTVLLHLCFALTTICLIAVAVADEDCGLVADLASAMRTGRWACARQLVERSPSEETTQLRSTYDMESRLVQNELKELKKVIESNLPQSSITPGDPQISPIVYT